MDFRAVNTDNISSSTRSLFFNTVTDYIRKNFRYSHDLLYSYSGNEFHITWKVTLTRLVFNYDIGDDTVRNARVIFIANDHTSETEMFYPFKPGTYSFFQDVLKCFCECVGAKVDKYFNSVYFFARNLYYQDFMAFKEDYKPVPGGWDMSVMPCVVCTTVEQVTDVIHVILRKHFVEIPITIIIPAYIKSLVQSGVYGCSNIECSDINDEVFLNIDNVDIMEYFNKPKFKFVKFLMKPWNSTD